jgi:hypothetical protein
MEDLLESMPYYWVTAQSEYSTDILFKSASHLSELYPRLLSHSTLCFGAKEVMSFLGKKIRSQFEGEVVTDVSDLSFKRIAGSRIKHRVKQNWLKIYDKAGSVLRLEMVINEPEGFTVRKEVTRKGKKVGRHAQGSAIRTLDRITTESRLLQSGPPKRSIPSPATRSGSSAPCWQANT